MTSDRQSPTVRRRRLSAELRRLRDQARMTSTEVAESLGWSRGKLSRIENAQWQRPNPRDVQDLLDLYGVTDDVQRAALIQLAKDSRQRGWWTAYRDVLAGSYVDLEAEASVIRTYEPLIVPGLLQTAAYIETVTRTALPRDPSDISRRVELRLERQRLLTKDDPLRCHAIIDETALIRPLGSVAAHRDQLQAIINAASLPNVTVQVMPLNVGMHPGVAGPFVLMEFPEDPLLVHIETGTDGLYLEKSEEVDRYTLVFNHLRAMALMPDASVSYLSEMVDRLG
ncbi:transcriptional regulator [Spongiactinospora rosea]|uniref:Transcriptional regulator n=2 Tax=Spongiactinospora rosea TaxID=2248750 RepID=A0A366M091_9ACTN|nr:transcriptional regulator [Spongiactinospora rosea]